MSKPTTSSIWIFRHAQRDRTADDQEDPGISREGFVQAGSIADYFKWVRTKYTGSYQFFASPKKRAQQTIKGAADILSVNVKIDPILDQRLPQESGEQFIGRVQHWIEQAELLVRGGGGGGGQNNTHLVVCSHSDWLDELLPRIPCSHDLTKTQYLHWPTAHFIQFHLDSTEPELWNFVEWRSLP